MSIRLPTSAPLFALSLCIFSCTTLVPHKDLPPPLTNDTFGKEVKVVTVPVPVIAASPNEGPSWGALAAFLLHNKEDEVSTLIAPQVNYNDNFGVSASLYGAFYPSPEQSWEFNVSKSTRVNEDYEVNYVNRSLRGGTVEAGSLFSTDGSARFFGFGSDSREADQTNFGDRETGIALSLEYPIADALRFVVGDRLRHVDIVQGAVRSVPFIGDRFNATEVPGLGGFTVHAQKIGIRYSTLDLPTLPTSGFSAEASVEGSARELGSSAGFVHYQVEIKDYVTAGKGRWISIFHIAYNRTPGGGVPFLERSILGGETTLRGFGRNRFIDSTSMLINVEERIRILRLAVFNVMTDWEVAPFIDCGGVMKSAGPLRRDDFEVNPGIGFRAVVRPNIVGRMDIGFGKEGAAVFVGLGYPF
jgi:hypothetical protein